MASFHQLHWEIEDPRPGIRNHRAPAIRDSIILGAFVIVENYTLENGAMSNTRPFVIARFHHPKSSWIGSRGYNPLATFYNSSHDPVRFVELAKEICDAHMIGIQIGCVKVENESASLLIPYANQYEFNDDEDPDGFYRNAPRSM